MDRLDHRIWRRRQEAIDQVGSWYRLRLRATITLELRPDAGEAEKGAIVVDRDSFFFVSGLGSGAYSAAVWRVAALVWAYSSREQSLQRMHRSSSVLIRGQLCNQLLREKRAGRSL